MKNISNNEISEMCSVLLGGFEQKILIEGKTADLPIVITLHGGPGTPIPFSVGCRGLFPVFTDRFIMVYWDQLGCGINDYVIDDRFNIASYVDMTADLVTYLKSRFPNNPIYLFGMSWGSVLALMTANRLPDIISGVVSWGQVLKDLFFNEEVYQALEDAGLSQKKMNRIRKINANNFKPKEMQFLTGCIRKYTNGNENKNGKKAPMGKMMLGIMRSKDYSMKDFKAMVINGCAKSPNLWPELLRIDLRKQLYEVKIPYYILQGDTDIITSSKLVKQTIADSSNSYLKYREIKNSGHTPGVDGMEAVLEELIEITGGEKDA